MSEAVKHYFAPIPNRAWMDERLATRPLLLRVLALIAAHDRFNKNGKGCTLSTGRMAEKLNATQSKVAAACRQLTEWGYLNRLPTPGHRQVYMHCVVYEPEADKAALKGKTQSQEGLGSTSQPIPCRDTVTPQTQSQAVLGSDTKPSPERYPVEGKTQSQGGLHKRLSSKEKEDTPLEEERGYSSQEARSDDRALLGRDSFVDDLVKRARIRHDLRKLEAALKGLQAGSARLSHPDQMQPWLERWRDFCIEVADSHELDDPLCQLAGRLIDDCIVMLSDLEEAA